MDEFRENRDFVDGLARGLAVIEAFTAERPEMTLSEVSQAINNSAAAVRRSLFTLHSLGYMTKVGRRFMLTPKILMLGAAYFQSARLQDAFSPSLRRFVEVFGDTSSIAVLSDQNILYIAQHSSDDRGIRPISGVGITYPAHATSMGQVLLASLSEEKLEAFLAHPLRQMTPETITEPERFKARILQVRAQGYASAVDQLAYGVTSIAVPIILPNNEVVAAVNTSGYSGHVNVPDLVRDRLEPLRQLAAQIAGVLQANHSLLWSLRQG